MPHIRRMAYLLILLIGAALLTSMAWKPAPPAKFLAVTPADVPRVIGGFAPGVDYQMPAFAKQYLATALAVSRTYGQGGDAVDFVLIGGTDRSELHDPRTCLVGQGWQLEDDHTEVIPGTGVEARDCHAVGAPGTSGYDIVYLYVVDGRTIDRVTQIRTAMLWSALLGKKDTPVYFLRFMVPLADDPATRAANHARLQQLAQGMWTALGPRLTRHV